MKFQNLVCGEGHFFSIYRSGEVCFCGTMELRQEHDGVYVRSLIPLQTCTTPLKEGDRL